MFTFTKMTPKQNISKHDFKTGLPKEDFIFPRVGLGIDFHTTDSLRRSVDNMERALETMGETLNMMSIPIPPPPKTQIDKFFELHTALKVSYISLFILFIIPTLVMLFLFVTGHYGTRTVNPEGVEYYEIYMNALSIIRIVGICISGLTLSIYTLWKSK